MAGGSSGGGFWEGEWLVALLGLVEDDGGYVIHPFSS